MIIIETKAAVRNRQSNRPFSIWSTPSAEMNQFGHEAVTEDNGGERVYADQLKLRIKPKFRLPKDATFFTAGSCFAREIERALHLAGQTVKSWNPASEIPNEQFHRYNTFSIINDFEFASGKSYDEENVIPLGNGQFSDFTGYGAWGSPEEVVEHRRKIIDVYKSSLDVDVVIITLGLVEAWFDRKTETYLNVSPYQLFHRHADRFELRITDYVENRAAVSGLIHHLKAFNPRVKIVLTVSPVPFSDTFSGQDVIVANTYSKSVLRSVAQDIAGEFDFVDYFPSFEIVMLSNPATAWLPDRRHVQRVHVEHILSEFMRCYFAKDASGGQDAADTVLD